MPFATALYDDEGEAFDAPYLKLVSRGKVKSPLNGPLNLETQPHCLHALAFSSTYGLLFHLGEGLTSLNVYAWPQVEAAYTNVERVQLQKANQALIKETISAAPTLASASLPTVFTSLTLSHAEHFILAWKANANAQTDSIDIFCFSTAQLAQNGNERVSAMIWQIGDLPGLRNVCLNHDDKFLAALQAPPGKPATLSLIDAASGEVLDTHELDHPAMGLAWAPDGNTLAVGLGDGCGEVVFFAARKDGKKAGLERSWTLETWNTSDDAVEFDGCAEIHQVCWPEMDTLLVCHRAMEGADQPPLPFVLVYTLRVAEKRADAACFVDNPLDFNEEKDKVWPHMYYVCYFKEWSTFMLSSSWTQRVAFIGIPAGGTDQEWKRWQVMAPSGDTASCFPEVLSQTFWSLAQRPWTWVEEHGSTRIDTSTYPIGMALATCSTKPISPFFILGGSRELDQIPDFSPPPTLLIPTTDGFIDVVAVAHKDFSVPKQIPGCSPVTQPLEDIPKIKIRASTVRKIDELGSSEGASALNRSDEGQESSAKPGLFGSEGNLAKPGLWSNVNSVDIGREAEAVKDVKETLTVGMIKDALKNDSEFARCGEFVGEVEGYAFRQGSRGLGYYPLQEKQVTFVLLADFTREEATKLLTRIYSKVNPEKTKEQMEKALDRYQGSYRRMFDAIEAKYSIKIEQFQGEEEAAVNTHLEKKKHDVNARIVEPPAPVESKKEPVVPASAVAAPTPVVKIQELSQPSYGRVMRLDVETPGKESNAGSVDRAELDALRAKCERLESDLDRASDFKVKFETPPRVKLTHTPVQASSVLDRIAALRRHEGASSFADLHKSTSGSATKSGGGHTEHLKTVMKLVSDRTSRLLAYSNSIAKENAAVDKLWKSNDESLAARTSELRSAITQLHDFVRSANRTKELQALQDRLAAIRRNYFLHEWAFHRCRSLISTTEDGSSADADADLRTAGAALEASVSEVCRAAEAMLEEIEHREEMALKRRRQLVQQAKLASLKRMGGVQTPTRQHMRKQAQRDVLKRVMDMYQRARLAQEAMKQQENRLRGLERECNLAAGMKESEMVTGEEKVALVIEDAPPRNTEVLRQEEEDNQMFVAELYSSLDALFSESGPPQVYSMSGMPLEASRMEGGTSPKEARREERRDRRAQRKTLAETIRSSPEPPRIGTKPEASMQRLQQAAKVPVPVSQLRETVIAAPPAYVPVKEKDLSVSFSKPQPPPAPTPAPAVTPAPAAGLGSSVPAQADQEAATPTPQAPSLTTLASADSSASAPAPAPQETSQAQAPQTPQKPLATTIPQTPESKAPDSSSQSFAPTNYDDVDMLATLKQFYMSHNPSNVAKIETTLAKYKGREAMLIAGLEKKYKTTVALVKKTTVSASSPPSTPTPSTPFGGASTPPTQVKKDGAASAAFGGTPPAFGSPQPAAAAGAPVFGSSGFQSSPAAGSAAQPQSQPPQSPFGAVQASGSTFGVDFRTQLVNFYTKYNPSKLGTVDQVLAKYRGQETKLFASLRKKYQVPVTETFNSPSGTQPAAGAASPSGTTAFGQTPSSPGGFGTQTFGSPGFGAPTSATTGFGGQQPAQAQQQAGATAFGSTGFGASSNTSSGFGSTSFGGTSFGAPQGGSGFGQTGFGGSSGGAFGQQTDYRARLVEFYTKHNPSKLSSVDAVLTKYRGRETELFAQLERKYANKAPAQGFGSGMNTTMQAPSTGQGFGSTGFGTTSGFGAAPATGFGNVQPQPAGGFGGQANAFGAQPAASSTGFGASTMGGGFGGSGFAGAASSGFGNQSAGGSGFGTTGFQTGTSFGSTNFGGSSFTQMRK